MTIANVYAKNGNNDDEKEDIVNHPKHYTSGKYEVIKIIEDKMTAAARCAVLVRILESHEFIRGSMSRMR